MQPLGENTANIPAFLGKLWKMVNDPSTEHLICWSSAGNSFVIQNQAQFWYELLPLYYKHNNMSSFVRQLNMYGFHKMSTVENGSLDTDKDEIQFYHPYFQKDQPQLLRNIKRKVTASKSQDASQTLIKSDELAKVLSDVKQLRGRQNSVDSQLSAMKQENSVLWRELAMLRQKHMKQQQIVNKLIQFLVTLVQPSAPSRIGVGVKRRMPLMLHESPNKKIKSKKQNHQFSHRHHDLGPTIHELDSEISPEEFFEEEIIDEPPPVEIPIPKKKTVPEKKVTSPSPLTPNTPSSTSSKNGSSKSPIGVIDEVSQDELNPDFIWDKPDFVNITHPEDGLSDNEENLIESLQKKAESSEKVFLNPNNRDTLLSNLIDNGNYNSAAVATRNTGSKKVDNVKGSNLKDANINPQQNNLTVATRDNNVKIGTNTRSTNDCFREDLDMHLDAAQSELDQLKDILNGCNTFDANALLGLFVDPPDYGLPTTNQAKNDPANDLGDPLVSGSELATCGNNLIDFNELFSDSLDGHENNLAITESELNSLTALNNQNSLDTPLTIKNEPLFPNNGSS